MVTIPSLQDGMEFASLPAIYTRICYCICTLHFVSVIVYVYYVQSNNATHKFLLTEVKQQKFTHKISYMYELDFYFTNSKNFAYNITVSNTKVFLTNT